MIDQHRGLVAPGSEPRHVAPTHLPSRRGPSADLPGRTRSRAAGSHTSARLIALARLSVRTESLRIPPGFASVARAGAQSKFYTSPESLLFSKRAFAEFYTARH
jgi:hypothetical protein